MKKENEKIECDYFKTNITREQRKKREEHVKSVLEMANREREVLSSQGDTEMQDISYISAVKDESSFRRASFLR